MPSRSVNCAVLVLSCDPYSDLWTPFFTLFRKYWADCPFSVFLGAGLIAQPPNGVNILRSSAGRDWSQCLLDYLAAIDTDYVLLMLDDFFIRRRVDTEKILHCLKFAEAKQAAQVRLVARPGPQVRLRDENLIGACDPRARYRVCAQAAIWRKDALRNLLVPGENAWEFETRATRRSESEHRGHYAVWQSVLPYEGLLAHHVIEKGCWLPHEKWIFARKNIGCDFSARKVLPWTQTVFCQAARIISYGLGVLPRRSRERFHQILRSLAYRLAPHQVKRLGGSNQSDLG